MLWTRLPGADEMDAYERVLGDTMHGDATLFAREDYVEEAWRIVDPVLEERLAGLRVRTGDVLEQLSNATSASVRPLTN